MLKKIIFMHLRCKQEYSEILSTVLSQLDVKKQEKWQFNQTIPSKVTDIAQFLDILRSGDATTHIENNHFLFKSHLNVNWHIAEWIPFYSPFTNNLMDFCSKMAFLRGNRAPEFAFSIQILYENFIISLICSI